MIKTLLHLFCLILLAVSCKEISGKSDVESNQVLTHNKGDLKFCFYNLENLFDTINDPKTLDDDFTPKGKYHWNSNAYNLKLKNISKALTEINADVIALAEVENKQVILDLIRQMNKDFKIVHYESHDVRGIDVALIYNAKIAKLIDHSEIVAKMPDGKYAGPRNILKVQFEYNSKPLNVYVNHWPSRRSDNAAKRFAYSEALSQEISQDNSGNIVVLGDFNDAPSDLSLKNLYEATKLTNPFLEVEFNSKGTSVYQYKWYLLDQILYKAGSKVKYKAKIEDFAYLKNQETAKSNKTKEFPRRTINGSKVDLGGTSDHFPVSLSLSL